MLAPMTTELVAVVRAVALAREAKGLYRGQRGSNVTVALANVLEAEAPEVPAEHRERLSPRRTRWTLVTRMGTVRLWGGA